MLPPLTSLASGGAPTSTSSFPAGRSLYRPEATPHHPHAHQSVVVKSETSQFNNGDDKSMAAAATAAQSLMRAKTNSERGKEFRAKRKKYEGELEKAVFKLRTQVSELDLQKSVWEKQFLDMRHTESGSLVKMVHEYFKLFRFGLNDVDVPPSPVSVAGSKRALVPSFDANSSRLESIRRQEAFIVSAMDSDALVGEKSGPAASLAQWRMYTVSHDSLRNEPTHIITTGNEEHPCVEVYSNVSGRISRDTFRYIFPAAMNNEALVQKFLHREVTYKSVFRFHFTEEGKIAVETADIGIVEGLQAAGFTVDDIADLMQLTVLTPQCEIPEPEEMRSPSPPPMHAPRQAPAASTKLSLGFLLGDDDLRPDERVEEIFT